MPAALGLGRSIGRSTSGLRCYAVAATAVKPPAAAAVKEAHGFVLDRQQYISEYDSHVLIYKHKKTGPCSACFLGDQMQHGLPC
jgi:hypothetical protein